jgi:hypothetical protein
MARISERQAFNHDFEYPDAAARERILLHHRFNRVEVMLALIGGAVVAVGYFVASEIAELASMCALP